MLGLAHPSPDAECRSLTQNQRKHKAGVTAERDPNVTQRGTGTLPAAPTPEVRELIGATGQMVCKDGPQTPVLYLTKLLAVWLCRAPTTGQESTASPTER